MSDQNNSQQKNLPIHEHKTENEEKISNLKIYSPKNKEQIYISSQLKKQNKKQQSIEGDNEMKNDTENKDTRNEIFQQQDEDLEKEDQDEEDEYEENKEIQHQNQEEILISLDQQRKQGIQNKKIAVLKASLKGIKDTSYEDVSQSKWKIPRESASKKINEEEEEDKRENIKFGSSKIVNSSSIERQYAQNIGWWKYLNFMYPFFKIKKIVDGEQMPTLQDFPIPLKNENIDYHFSQLKLIWDNLVKNNAQVSNGGQLVMQAIKKKFGKGLIKSALLGLFDSLLKIISCVSMGIIMSMITLKSMNAKEGQYSLNVWIVQVTILFFSLTIGVYCKTWFYHYTYELASKMRFSLLALIYEKILNVKINVLSGQIPAGRILNMCANDLNDLDYGLSWLFQLLLLPVNMVITTFAIYYYLGVYSGVGVVTLIIFIGFQEYYTTRVAVPMGQKNILTDQRINFTKELVLSSKILKMYSWDKVFQQQIERVRNKELNLTREVMECIGIARSISNGSVLLSAFFMCALYHYFSGEQLTAEKVFGSLSILNVVKSCLGYFSSSRGWLANITLLSERVSQILLAPKQNEEPSILMGQFNDTTQSSRLILNKENKQGDQANTLQTELENLQTQAIQVTKTEETLTQETTDSMLSQKPKKSFADKQFSNFNELTQEEEEDKILKRKNLLKEESFSAPVNQKQQQNRQQIADKPNLKQEKSQPTKKKIINSKGFQKLEYQEQEDEIEEQQQKDDCDDDEAKITNQQFSEERPQINSDNLEERSFKKLVKNKKHLIIDKGGDLFSIKEKSSKKDEKSGSDHEDGDSSHEDNTSSDSSGKSREKKYGNIFIKMNSFNGFWDTDDQSLFDINLELTNRFKFVQIIGNSGSGKTTLLMSIIKEIAAHTGQLIVEGTISYVPQEAVIYSGTIKHNILFGSEYDYIRYSQVKALCNLHIDLEKMPKKDDTQLQEGGSNLSGGQKMRINLARALYSKSDILLLDDPLAALDAKVSERIFKQMFKTKFLDGRLVLMSSHQLQYSQEADYILIMNEGRIVKKGTYEDLKQNIREIQYNEQKDGKRNEAIMAKYKAYEAELQANIWSTTSGTSFDGIGSKKDSHDSSDMDGNEENFKTLNLDIMKQLAQTDGYKSYVRNMGGITPLAILLIGYILCELCYILFTNKFGAMSDGNETVIKCGCFALAFLVFDIAKTIYFCRLNYFASKQLHQKMLTAITNAPLSFFAANSSGNVINRFSNDVGVLDKTLPACLLDLLKGLISNLILIATVCVFNLPLLPLATIILFGLVYTRKEFQKVISISKQADLTSRSPIFNHLQETLANLTVLRVFKQQNRFQQLFLRTIYDNSRAFYSMSKNQRMFDLLLELLITFMVLIGISYILASLFLFEVEGDGVTLSIYFLINLGQGFSYAVRQTLTADINMLSTQRIQEYIMIESEEQENQKLIGTNNLIKKGNSKSKLLASKPISLSEGKIQFKNVSLKYPNDIKLTLKKLNFTINSAEKIGVVGRTGAGKSSLVNALFRLYPIQFCQQFESYIKIDGVSINDIPLDILRSSISIIPQEPVIFQGNARFNLDPMKQFSDEKLMQVIADVGLSNKVESLEEDLSSLSSGEKQLISLARAFLKQSKILILDEVTANLDKSVDEFIQEKVRKLFKDRTVIAIAHRLISIADYDKIMVLDSGYLKDFDQPFMHLVENEQDTKITKKKNIFAGLVKNTGKEASRMIMQKAREVYFASKNQADQQKQLDSTTQIRVKIEEKKNEIL